MKEQELKEHIDFVNHMFQQTKNETLKLNATLKQMEKNFTKNVNDELVLEDLQEIFETIQSLNHLLLMSQE